MNELNLIQDMDFVETQDAAAVVGGTTIAYRPMPGGDWDDHFPKPLPPVHPPRPIHPPIFEFPKPHPRPYPLPRPFPLPHPLPIMTTH